MYGIRASLPSASCKAFTTQGGAVLQTGRVDLGNIPFTEAETTDSGMSHLRSDRVYTALHGGDCYIFDLALLRAGAGAIPGVQPMSSAEQSEVENEMQQILSSVSFHS